MKLLLTGFQPLARMSYPHLEQVASHLLAKGADYCLFRERGYFLGEKFRWRDGLRAIAERGYAAMTVVVDSLGLLRQRLRGQHDLVVAVDNFSYLVAAMLFPRVVLWSHDFLTRDEPRCTSTIQRFIFRRVRLSLLRHRSLIIQDQDRLALFLDTYLHPGEREGLDVFLLPVSVHGTDAVASSEPATPPILMQIGGINAWRSRSDQLLADYQRNHETYALALHGFFDAGMAQQVAKAEKLPWISSIPLAARDVGRAVEKCDIGFIAYNAGNQNFFNIARASGQLAEFLRCGKPVITLGPSNLRAVLEQEGFGIGIDDFSQLPEAVRRIASRYPEYCANCRRVFSTTYDLGRHLEAMTAWLSNRGQEKT